MSNDTNVASENVNENTEKDEKASKEKQES